MRWLGLSLRGGASMKIADATFDELKRFGMAYHASFDKLKTIDDFELHINQFIVSGAYYHEGKILDARHLVDKVHHIKIEIYSNEHPPPHFHIVSNEARASFAIDDCRELENSGFSSREIKNIRDWFIHSKEKLIEVWNKTRPDNCVAGVVK